MQIIRANHLHVKKENWKETLRRQQEEGGNKNIVTLGDHTKCPQCDRIGRVVWISQDGKTAGIQCSASHRQMNRPDSRLGSNARPQSKTSKNMVFLMEIKDKNTAPLLNL
jgi:hypothetical protein